MKKQIITFLRLGALLSCLLLVPDTIFAQSAEFVPLTNIPGLTDLTTAPTLPVFLSSLYRICIGAAAVIAILQIMRAGISIIRNPGSVTQNKDAKDLIYGAVGGLVLVLAPYVVFSVINPQILELNLDVSGLSSKPTEPAVGSVERPVAVAACTTYPNPTLRFGRPVGQCLVGEDNLQLGCCASTVTSGYACCGVKAGSQYMLQYYYTAESNATKNACVFTTSTPYADKKVCEKSLASAKSLSLNTGSHKATSALKVDAACTATTSVPTTYKPSTLPECGI